MTTGMLWRMDGTDSLASHVARAAAHYQGKYGVAPNTCFVNPATLSPDGAPRMVGTVRVRPLRTVLVGHLWMGVECEADHATDR